ncbi:MAG: aminoacyl-tRNA hydrolase [Bdellovibrionales bacterium]|nr:aminoacyl-tRNA hydrolase [Bdellovibrionales bacterium]
MVNDMSPLAWQQIVDEVKFQYSRSSGPGGQHVNRTESRVELRFDLVHSKALNPEQKALAIDYLESALKRDCYIIVVSEEHRSRKQNQLVCLKKLKSIIERALFIPKKRVRTKPNKSAVKKRLETKKKRGLIKKLRQKTEAE